MPSSPRTGIRPGVALGLLGLALCAWIGVFVWRSYKSPAQRHVEAAEELAQKGQRIEAVREWEAALQLDPDNADVQQILGQSYYAGGQWRRALDHLLPLQRLRPDAPRLDSMLASCLLQLGDAASTVKYAGAALKRNPDDVLALESCVTAQARLGDAIEERRCLERLVQLQPQNGASLLKLAELVMNARDFAECRALADRVLQTDPGNAEAHAMRGMSAFFMDGSPEGMRQAEDDLLHGLSYPPYVYPCHLYLGRIYRRLERYPQALEHLQAAIRLNPNQSDAYYDLATVYDRTGQARLAESTRNRFQSLAEAKERVMHLQKQLEFSPNDFSLQLQAGLLTLKLGDLPAATRYLQQAARLRPDDAGVQRALAQLAQSHAPASVAASPAPAAPAHNSPAAGGQ